MPRQSMKQGARELTNSKFVEAKQAGVRFVGPDILLGGFRGRRVPLAGTRVHARTGPAGLSTGDFVVLEASDGAVVEHRVASGALAERLVQLIQQEQAREG